MKQFCVIDGCPAPANIAPYIYLVLRKAGQTANSIYRGDDAAAILHAHGKHTQRELYETLPPGVANPPGFSTHELFNDGVAYSVPRGHWLNWWQVGVDSGFDTAENRNAIQTAAASLGFKVFHPYSAGVELHHWNFVEQPHPKNIGQRARLLKLYATLPRR